MNSSSGRSAGQVPISSSSHRELFSQAGEEEKSLVGGGGGGGGGGDMIDDSPLQLEHILGYAGDFRNTCLTIPSLGDGKYFVKGMGSLVVIENLLDPHDQKLLRGHDSQISAIAVSPSGSYIASGQVGTEKYRGRAAPIFIWDTITGRRLTNLRGLTTRVNAISFSLDERFVCACGEDCSVYVWNLQTSETITCQRVQSPPTILKWVFQQQGQLYTSYELVMDIGDSVMSSKLNYDPIKAQWNLKLTPYAVPSNGRIIRTFTCVETSAGAAYIYVGTTAGEVIVYKRESAVFRACIPVCRIGVQSIVVLPQDGNIVCGGGDGSIKMISGEDMTWRVALETKLGAAEGKIRSLSCTSSGAELLVTCSSGTILRCLSDTFAFSVIGNANTSGITCMTFSPASGSGVFATGTKGGELRVWDVIDYACLATTCYTNASVMSVCFSGPDSLMSGWDDGAIRCHDATTLSKLLWSIPTAHRGGTRSIACHSDPTLQYFVTGGMDGAVRVWRLASRELVSQYNEHKKGVMRVLVDVASPNIVHSMSIDCSVLSYDLRAAKRIICHLVTSTGGSMTDMTQRNDGKWELITCDAQARLLHWDINVRDPIVAVQDPSMAALKCALISPSGRFLAFAGDDQIVKVLDMIRGNICALGNGHSSPILTLAWTPDEKQIISGGDDGNLCIWNFYLA